MFKLSFQQQILGGFIAFLLCGFSLAVISYNSVNTLQDASSWVDNSQKVLAATARVQQLLTDSETGERGYVLTGQESFLEPYNRSSGVVIPTVQDLRKLASDNPSQVSRVDSLNFYANQKLSEIANIIKARNEGGLLGGQQRIMSNQGRVIMAKINSIIIEITNAENKLLVIRKAKSVDTVISTSVIIFIGSVIEIAILILLLTFIRSTFKEQKSIEQRVLQANDKLKEISEENATKNWILTGSSSLDRTIRGEININQLATKIINELAKHVDAQVATIYLMDSTNESLKLSGSYAFTYRKHNNNTIHISDGMIGQAIFEKKAIVFNNLPSDYVKVTSGLGEAVPHSLLIQPFLFEGEVKGVMEFGFANPITTEKMEFIEMVVDAIGVAFNTAQSRVQLHQLFNETQQQSEELETQQEELRTTNEELMRKTQSLQASEEELRVQQEELRQINSELEEKAELLEERNHAVEQAREAIGQKAEELEQTSKYKSEFLANMSHELRTPLNSILILARILKENKKNNLNDEQIKYASVIQNAGSDLLTLINDILDLSKIESGKIDLTIEDVEIVEVRRDIELLFNEVANNKKIQYDINIGASVPPKFVSDRMRLEQIIKNLLSNAFKFTPEKGAVSLNIDLAPVDTAYTSSNLAGSSDNPILAFAVKDTGIGIPFDKQKAIFEAFQQADGSTSRKYGGTGLGLSISRELSNILGGEIQITSVPNEGSTFTLFLPVAYHQEYVLEPDTSEAIERPSFASSAAPAPVPVSAPAPHIAKAGSAAVPPAFRPAPIPVMIPVMDNKEHIMLIVEDDANFADILKNYAVERGFKPMLADTGDKGLEMAFEYLPDSIILDIMLPGMDGWSILKKLKENPKTKNIPVHMMSAGDGGLTKAKSEGAIGFLKKPVEKEKLDEAFDKLTSNEFSLTKVLIVEDHEIQSENLRRQLADHDVQVIQAFNGEEALNSLRTQDDFDCIILDVNLPDISGLDLLDKIKADSKWIEIPVIINTAMEMDKDSMARVMKHTHAMVLKSSRSNDRLLDEVNLFMNKVKNDDKEAFNHHPFPKKVKPIITLEKALVNKSVLIVDDDMRNIFALSSALQGFEMNIEIAINGLDALKKLNDRPNTDIVLMDIMMPEMDGYEAMREIRKQERFSKLPILALTAKAMKNDREKCIEAGANDYVSKPVDIDKLVSMMRVWLS
ncbi:MAG: Histidine kinase [Sphingobacteriales bacterium]|nr:Histidine kinase [Sphingobacteriales bacterium]